MKRNILFVLMFLVIPMAVYADSIIIDCPSEIKKGTTFNCTINGNSEKDILSLSAKVQLGSGLEFVSFIPADGWLGDGLDGEIELYGADNMHDIFNIGTLKLKNIKNDNNVIAISSIFFNDIDGVEKSINNISKNIDLEKEEIIDNNQNDNNSSNDNINNNTTTNNSTNTENNNQTNDKNDNSNDLNSPDVISSAYLIDLQIEGYDIDFSKEVFDYTLKIGNESNLNITPFLEDGSSTCIIKGNENLSNGSIITLEIETENGKKQKYTITITKENVEKEEKKDYKVIFIVIIIILVFINVIRLINGRRKKNEK